MTGIRFVIGGAGVVALVLAISQIPAAFAEDDDTTVAAEMEEKAEKAEAEAKEVKKEAKKEIKGSDSKGKYYYKKSCKTCHGKKGDGGEITPMSKTIKQWERYFKKGNHTGEETLLEVIDEEKLIHIKTFLINHAADSDQPETCG